MESDRWAPGGVHLKRQRGGLIAQRRGGCPVLKYSIHGAASSGTTLDHTWKLRKHATHVPTARTTRKHATHVPTAGGRRSSRAMQHPRANYTNYKKACNPRANCTNYRGGGWLAEKCLTMWTLRYRPRDVVEARRRPAGRHATR